MKIKNVKIRLNNILLNLLNTKRFSINSYKYAFLAFLKIISISKFFGNTDFKLLVCTGYEVFWPTDEISHKKHLTL